LKTFFIQINTCLIIRVGDLTITYFYRSWFTKTISMGDLIITYFYWVWFTRTIGMGDLIITYFYWVWFTRTIGMKCIIYNSINFKVKNLILTFTCRWIMIGESLTHLFFTQILFMKKVPFILYMLVGSDIDMDTFSLMLVIFYSHMYQKKVYCISI